MFVGLIGTNSIASVFVPLDNSGMLKTILGHAHGKTTRASKKLNTFHSKEPFKKLSLQPLTAKISTQLAI